MTEYEDWAAAMSEMVMCEPDPTAQPMPLRTISPERIKSLPVDISAVLGTCTLTVGDVKQLGVGSIVELDQGSDNCVMIFANGKHIAFGECILVNGKFAVKIVEIVT